MLVPIGKQKFEMPGPYLAELRESNDIVADVPALRQRMEDDGYLFIRGLHPRENVLAARRAIFEKAAQSSPEFQKPGSDLMDAVINPGSRWPHMMGRKGYTHEPAVLNVLEGKPIFDFMQGFLGEPARTFDYKWLRAVGSEGFTGSHYDVVYMGRGSQRLYTVWTPMGDIPIEQGTLCICQGSHNLPGFAKVRETYGRMDVDRDRVDGWFESDPLSIVEKFGGTWRTTNFRAGDVLLFGMFTMHCSTNNQTDRWRLSCDTRFQPAADPVDERWVGENPIAHYAWYSEPEKMKKMETARAEWGV